MQHRPDALARGADDGGPGGGGQERDCPPEAVPADSRRHDPPVAVEEGKAVSSATGRAPTTKAPTVARCDSILRIAHKTTDPASAAGQEHRRSCAAAT